MHGLAVVKLSRACWLQVCSDYCSRCCIILLLGDVCMTDP